MFEPLSSRTDSQLVNNDTDLEQYLHAATVKPDAESISPRLRTGKTENYCVAPNYIKQEHRHTIRHCEDQGIY